MIISLGDMSRDIILQFGSINAGMMNGLQVSFFFVFCYTGVSCALCNGFFAHTWEMFVDYERFLPGPAQLRRISTSRNVSRFVNILT